MPITTNNPITVPASDEKTYDTWWVENLSLDATLTAGPEPILVVDYRLCYLDQNQMPVFHPTEPKRRVQIRDLFTYTATRPDVYAAVWGAVEVLGNIGKTEGVLD